MGNLISSENGVRITSEMKKAINQIKYDNDFWKVRWRGMSFSIKPFLCSGMSFMHRSDVCNYLVNYIVHNEKDFYSRLSDMTSIDYLSGFTEDELDLLRCVLYQLNSYTPCVMIYLLGREDIKAAKTVMNILMDEYVFECSGKSPYIDISESGLCNTEAFSYYISMYWVLQKSPKLKMLATKELKPVNFDKLLGVFCPDSSIHMSYFRGTITAKELMTEYTSKVVKDEVFALWSDSYSVDIDMTQCNKDLLTQYVNISTHCSYGDFSRLLHASYFELGYYKEAENNVKDLEGQISNLTQALGVSEEDNRSLQNSIKSLTKESSRIMSLYTELAKKETESDDSIVSDLRDEVSDLKACIADLNAELDSKENELLSSKRVLKSKIKEIKSLRAILEENECIGEPLAEDFTDIQEDTIDFSEMVSKVKELKIGVFGGFEVQNLEDRFSEYGVSIRHVIEDSQFVVGDIDCAVVITSSIKHCTVFRLKKQYRGTIVYVNGTSVENIIQKIYESMFLCDIEN